MLFFIESFRIYSIFGFKRLLFNYKFHIILSDRNNILFENNDDDDDDDDDNGILCFPHNLINIDDFYCMKNGGREEVGLVE